MPTKSDHGQLREAGAQALHDTVDAAQLEDAGCRLMLQALVAPRHQGFHGHRFDRMNPFQNLDDEVLPLIFHAGTGQERILQMAAGDDRCNAKQSPGGR